MTGPKIRAARPADAAAIARVHVETWRAAYAGLVPDAYLVGMSVQGQTFVWKKLIARQKRREQVLVAEPEKGVIAGFGSFGPARGGAAGLEGEVYTLYVAGDWQGRGIGRRLLTALFQDLAGQGVAGAYLWVLSSNPSRFFYERMGGRRAAERQETFAGTLLDETAYAWPDLKAWLTG